MLVRKQFKIPASKKAKLTEFAQLSGVRRTHVLHEWIQSFKERGTDYVPEPLEKIETLIDLELLLEAEQLAKDAGFTLRDMVLFEIDEIDKL